MSIKPTIRRGFTMAEMTVVMTLVLITAALVLPQVADNDRVRLIAASSVLSSDIELAQVMTISDPSDPVIVRFNSATMSYWLALERLPEVPISRPDTGEPYLVQIGAGRAGGAEGVSFTIHDMASNALVFDAQGGIKDFTSKPAVELSLGEDRLLLDVSPMTGMISERE